MNPRVAQARLIWLIAVILLLLGWCVKTHALPGKVLELGQSPDHGEHGRNVAGLRCCDAELIHSAAHARDGVGCSDDAA